MTPDTKVKVFDTKTLNDIDKAYRDVKLFIADIDDIINVKIFKKDDVSSKQSFDRMINYIKKAMESISNMKIE
jgi:hypothetical protein